MAGVKDYSTSASSNVAVGGISISPGMARAGVDDAIRALMADLASDYDTDVIHAVNYGVTTCTSWASSSNQAVALQAAIDAAKNAKRDLLLPQGVIRVDTALDCTDIHAGAGAFRIRGAGYGFPSTGSGTVIMGNTGGVVFDFTGSQWSGLEDLTIDATIYSPPTPSTIGVLFARATVSLYCQFDFLRNVYIGLPTSMASNGATGSYGVLNLTGEIHNYHNLIVSADNPVAMLATKPAWLSSPFKTIDNTITSMSVVAFTGFTSLTGLSTTRPAIRAENLKCCTFDMLYTLGSGTCALDLEGCDQITVGGSSIEGHGYIAAILRNGCNNIDINYYSLGTPASPVRLGSSFSIVQNVTLRGTYNSGWTRIVETDNVGNVLDGLTLNLTADSGSVSTTNVAAANLKHVRRGNVDAPVTLTDAATVTPDFFASNTFEWTIGGNRTLANPTNAHTGQTGTIKIVQDATGTRVVTYGSNWRFPGGSAAGGVLSVAANAIDVIRYTVNSDGKIYAVLDKAFAA